MNPEDQAKPPEPPAAAAETRRGLLATPISLLIPALNIAVFLMAEHVGKTTETATLVRFGAIERGRIWDGEYWRLVTPMFLHIGWMHLIWNTLMMFGLCRTLERVLGSPRFAAAYLATGIGASAASVLAHDVVAAGASGAGFGLIGVVFVLFRRKLGRWGAFFENPDVRKTLVNVVIWVGIGFTVMPMDNFAHLGGLAFGLAVGWALTERPLRPVPLTAALLVLAMTATAACYPWPGRTALYSAYEAGVAGEEAERHGNRAAAIAAFERSLRLAPSTWEGRAIVEKKLRSLREEKR